MVRHLLARNRRPRASTEANSGIVLRRGPAFLLLFACAAWRYINPDKPGARNGLRDQPGGPRLVDESIDDREPGRIALGDDDRLLNAIETVPQEPQARRFRDSFAHPLAVAAIDV